MIGKDNTGGKYSSRVSRIAEQYPGAVNYQANDENQSPRTFEYDRVEADNPGITLSFGWEYLKVGFLWLEDDCWNDLNFEGLDLLPGATAPGLGPILASGNLQVYRFDGSSRTEEVFGGTEILHDYKEGTDLSVHVHWMPVDTGTGTVRWYFEYAIQNIDETFGAPNTIYGEEEAGGTAWYHHLTSLGSVDGADLKVGSHLMFRLYRDPGEDTYGSDAALLSVGVHYEVDSLGSRQIGAK